MKRCGKYSSKNARPAQRFASVHRKTCRLISPDERTSILYGTGGAGSTTTSSPELQPMSVHAVPQPLAPRENGTSDSASSDIHVRRFDRMIVIRLLAPSRILSVVDRRCYVAVVSYQVHAVSRGVDRHDVLGGSGARRTQMTEWDTRRISRSSTARSRCCRICPSLSRRPEAVVLGASPGPSPALAAKPATILGVAGSTESWGQTPEKTRHWGQTPTKWGQTPTKWGQTPEKMESDPIWRREMESDPI
jgi:hypothetical protein